MLQQIYYFSKKIHVILMWFSFVLGIPVAVTGMLIEEPEKWEMIFTPVQMYSFRKIHGEWSTKFALVLALMMVTGFLLWLIPRMLSSKTKK